MPYLYPQDEGNGLTPSNSDYVDAALIAQIAHNPNAANLVVSGFGFTPDFTVPSVSVGAGVARISSSSGTTPDHTADDGPASFNPRNITYVAQTDSTTTISLTDAAVNEVYLDIDPGSQDYVSISAFTSGGSPTTPYLKLGTVDTTNDTYTVANRRLKNYETDSVVASGDGTSTTFSLPHSLGQVPSAANVTPTSEDGSTSFWVSAKTATAVEITYGAAPPTGTDNLSYDVVTYE